MSEDTLHHIIRWNVPFLLGREPYARGLLTRRRWCLLLHQLVQSLSSALVQPPRGPPSPRGTGAGRDKECCVSGLGDELGDDARLCSDVFSGVLGGVLALHRLSLQDGWARTWLRD